MLVRAGTPRPDVNPPDRRHARARSARGWPAWSASTIPAWPAASSPPACSTAGSGATCGRRRWCWPALALLLRLEFVVDGLGHVFRSPRQQRALQHAYDASWFSRLLVTILLAVALLAVLAVVVALTSRGIWRALGRGGPPLAVGPRAAPAAQGTRPTAHSLLTVGGERRPRRHPAGHRGAAPPA